jgi:HSP20 family molecular chaperone IbpA
LKAFDNNKDNIKIKIENNGIKIDGKYSKKGEKQTEERSFYQNVIFPQKIKENKTEEKQEKDKLIIHLPIEK